MDLVEIQPLSTFMRRSSRARADRAEVGGDNWEILDEFADSALDAALRAFAGRLKGDDGSRPLFLVAGFERGPFHMGVVTGLAAFAVVDRFVKLARGFDMFAVSFGSSLGVELVIAETKSLFDALKCMPATSTSQPDVKVSADVGLRLKRAIDGLRKQGR